jgi:hypothetical protein
MLAARGRQESARFLRKGCLAGADTVVITISVLSEKGLFLVQSLY